MNDFEFIMENWRNYERRETLLENPEYVTGVLGIQIPLNESYPYSPALTEEILQEHLLYEGFISSLMDKAKKETGKIKDLFVTLYKIFQEPDDIDRFIYLLDNKVIKRVANAFRKVFKKLHQSSISDFIEGISQKFEDLLGKYSDMSIGWKKAMAGTSIALMLQFIYDKAKDLLNSVFEMSSEDIIGSVVTSIKTELTDFLQEFMGPELINNVLAKLADIKTYLGWIAPIVGGVQFVATALYPMTSRFAAAKIQPAAVTTEI